MNWIPVTDHYPEKDQKVIYYFKYVGIHRGKYFISEKELCEGLRCFGGENGWLCEDVTHWMPDEGQDLDQLERP